MQTCSQQGRPYDSARYAGFKRQASCFYGCSPPPPKRLCLGLQRSSLPTPVVAHTAAAGTWAGVCCEKPVPDIRTVGSCRFSESERVEAARHFVASSIVSPILSHVPELQTSASSGGEGADIIAGYEVSYGPQSAGPNRRFNILEQERNRASDGVCWMSFCEGWTQTIQGVLDQCFENQGC